MRSVIGALVGLLLVGVATTEAVSPQDQIKALEERVATLENALDELTNRVATLEDSIPGNNAPTRPHIVDSLGQVVGVVLDQVVVTKPLDDPTDPGTNTVLFEAAVMMQLEGIPAIVRVTPNAITGFLSPTSGGAVPLYFDDGNCTGNPYIVAVPNAKFGGKAVLFGDRLYIPKPEPGVVIRELPSRVIERNDGMQVCDTGGGTNTYVQAVAVPLSVFDGFVQPFSLVGLPQFP